MPDDVGQLVRQAVALAYPWLVGVHQQHPGVAIPLRPTGARQPSHPFERDARQRFDDVVDRHCRSGYLIQPQQPGGLAIQNLARFTG